jgi:hypothetical protein
MVLVGKTNGKRLFGRPRRRWEDKLSRISVWTGGGNCKCDNELLVSTKSGESFDYLKSG